MLVNKGDPNVSPESAAFYGYVTTVVRNNIRVIEPHVFVFHRAHHPRAHT